MTAGDKTRAVMNKAAGQNGTIIVVTLLILAALTLSALMAVNMAVCDGSVMRNSRMYQCDLYRAETGITVARETHADTWLAPDSVLFDLSLDNAGITVDQFSIPGVNGEDLPAMGRYVISRIESVPAPGSPSERFYALSHRAPMPSGSGFSAMNFEIRRYGIISTGSSKKDRPGSGVTVEAGLYKVFNRF
jgi:hypothetical protein